MKSCLHSLGSPHTHTTSCLMIYFSESTSAISLHRMLWSGGLELGIECCADTLECCAHRVAAPSPGWFAAVLRSCELPAGLPGHWWWRQFRGRRGRWCLHSRP